MSVALLSPTLNVFTKPLMLVESNTTERDTADMEVVEVMITGITWKKIGAMKHRRYGFESR